ncbi:MAG TPA: hypothetical protein VN420_01810 [Candidatus Fimivivens sp.]|nr:hypothetical protein [Candidatus Fimivivens sp.]
MKTYLYVGKDGTRYGVVVGDGKGLSWSIAERELIPKVRSYLERIPRSNDNNAFVAVLLDRERVLGAGLAFPVPEGFFREGDACTVLEGPSYSLHGGVSITEEKTPEMSVFVVKKSGRLCVQAEKVGCTLPDLETLFRFWSVTFSPVAPESVFVRVGKSVLLQMPKPEFLGAAASILPKKERIEERLLV